MPSAAEAARAGRRALRRHIAVTLPLHDRHLAATITVTGGPCGGGRAARPAAARRRGAPRSASGSPSRGGKGRRADCVRVATEDGGSDGGSDDRSDGGSGGRSGGGSDGDVEQGGVGRARDGLVAPAAAAPVAVPLARQCRAAATLHVEARDHVEITRSMHTSPGGAGRRMGRARPRVPAPAAKPRGRAGATRPKPALPVEICLD